AAVALFALAADAVATPGGRAVRVAAVTVRYISVVALFAFTLNAVSAFGRRTVRIAAVAVDVVPVVADFALRVHAAVAARAVRAVAEADDIRVRLCSAVLSGGQAVVAE